MRGIFVFILSFIIIGANAQGINFQGVARSANGTILATSNISLRLSVLSKSVDATPEYVETKKVVTNAQGIFSIVIGDGATATVGSFKSINWADVPKFLKVEMDPSGGSNFISMGTTSLQYVPFSYYSNGVDAVNVNGVLPIKSGGTGVGSISDLKVSLGLDKLNNTADIDKPISALTQTALDTKLNKADTITLSNRINSKLTKADTLTLSSRIDTKASTNNPVFSGIISGTLSGTASNVTGVVSVVNGGTNTSTLSLNNVILGNGNSGVKFVEPGFAGNVLTSDGTTWKSQAPSVSGAQIDNNTRRVLNYIYLKY
jgi:hypothetical protein